MTHAWDRCSGLHWTRSDSAAALGHGPRGHRAGPPSRARRRDRPQPPALTVKLFDPRLSLEALAVQVAGHEILIGPLEALAATAEGTAATFARALPPPARAQLRRRTADPLPAGWAGVCEGSAWIDGSPAAVAAVRPGPD